MENMDELLQLNSSKTDINTSDYATHELNSDVGDNSTMVDNSTVIEMLMQIKRLMAENHEEYRSCGDCHVNTEVVGTATLDFYLGEICVRQQVWIAEIKEDCILGADFLMKRECVIDYPQNVLRIGSTEVPMHANTDELKCLRIVLDRTIKVPGNSEMVISAKLDGTPREANCGAIGPAAITKEPKG